MTTTQPVIPVRVKPIKLNAEAVREYILSAEGETQAIERVFRLVYPNFDDIKSVNGYPVCNRATWLLICGFFRTLTLRLNEQRGRMNQIMPGGAWLNWGFSSTDREGRTMELADWQVVPAEVTT